SSAARRSPYSDYARETGRQRSGELADHRLRTDDRVLPPHRREVACRQRAREAQLMLPDGNQVSVAEPMLADTASVHEAAVRAVQVEQEPAVARLHEQVLIAADIAALETDVAGGIPAEDHPRAHEPDLGDRAAAARDDEPCIL